MSTTRIFFFFPFFSSRRLRASKESGLNASLDIEQAFSVGRANDWVEKKHRFLRGTRATLFVGSLNSQEVAQCLCVDGYAGTMCDDTLDYCGDGIINPQEGEECDDGNNAASDGCGSTCRIEQNWRCLPSPRTDVLEVEGVAPSLISRCSCPGIFSSVMGCLAAGL